VNMIGHETVSPQIHSGLERLLGQQIPIDLLASRRFPRDAT
jgi:hypothetical protein